MWASTPTKLVRTASEVLNCYIFRGKSPEKPKRFFWSVQGGLGGNRNPPRLFFFCQRFLLEKQKKMLCRTCKFAVKYQPFNCSPKRRRGKKDTPVPRFGTRACLLRGATQIRGIFKIPPLLRRLRAARTGDFGAFAPYTHARRTSFPGSLQKPFSKAAFSLRRRGSGTASASLRVIGSIFCFSSSYANPDRRAAARGSAFLPRPDWSHRGRCTYRTGGACA